MNLNDKPATDAATAPVLSTSPYPAGPAFLEAHWMPYTGNRNFKAQPAHDGQRQGRVFHRCPGAQDF